MRSTLQPTFLLFCTVFASVSCSSAQVPSSQNTAQPHDSYVVRMRSWELALSNCGIIEATVGCTADLKILGIRRYIQFGGITDEGINRTLLFDDAGNPFEFETMYVADKTVNHGWNTNVMVESGVTVSLRGAVRSCRYTHLNSSSASNILERCDTVFHMGLG